MYLQQHNRSEFPLHSPQPKEKKEEAQNQNQNTLDKYNSIYRPFSHGSLSLTFSVSLLLVKQTSPKSAQGKRETSGSGVARYCRWFSAQKLLKTLQNI